MKNYISYFKKGIIVSFILFALTTNAQVNIKHNEIIYPDETSQKTALSGGIWTLVEEYDAVGDGTTDDYQAIQDALDNSEFVSLSPGKRYLIGQTLEIDNSETLYIPSNSTLIFDENSSDDEAIIMKSHSTLAGKGTIQSSRYNWENNEWNISDIKTAIKIVSEGVNVEIGNISGFEYGFYMGGPYGIVGCNINVSYFINVLYCFVINPYKVNNTMGFVNQNYFHWNITSLRMDTTHPLYPNTCGIYMDGAGEPNHNTFNGSVEGYYIGLKLAGAFNRFLGFRAESCGYTVVIHNAGAGCSTRFNTIFGEYGNVNEFYNGIENQQSESIQYAVQIYGPEGGNLLQYVKADIVTADYFFTSSDLSLKKNVSNVQGALNKILALRGTTYNLKTDSIKDNENKKKYSQYGFIAQELKEVLPELVSRNPLDSMYVINYNGVIPVLVEAFKEQQELIEQQENDIDELKEQNNKFIEILKEKGIIENKEQEEISETPMLYQNNPNPYNTITEIHYNLPYEFKEAYILIMDMNDKLLIRKDIHTKGRNKITIYANELSAGMYIYCLVSDGKVIGTKRMVLTE